MDARDHDAVPGLARPELARQIHVALAPLGTAAAHAVVTCTNREARDSAIVGGRASTEMRNQVLDQSNDCGERSYTLRAQSALSAYSLRSIIASDGPMSIFIARWDMVPEMRDMATGMPILQRAGGHDA